MTPEEKDASPPTMSPGRLDCAPDASGPSLLQRQALARRESYRSVCVSLCYFFPFVCGFFPWSRFIGIPVIKTWCSLGALMWPAVWAGPSLLFPPHGIGFGLWRSAKSLGHLPSRSPHTLPPSTPPTHSRLTLRVVSRVPRTQASCTPPQEVTSAACATCRLCLALLLSSSLPHKKPLADRQQNRIEKPGLLQKLHTVPPCIKSFWINDDVRPTGGSKMYTLEACISHLRGTTTVFL